MFDNHFNYIGSNSVALQIFPGLKKCKIDLPIKEELDVHFFVEWLENEQNQKKYEIDNYSSRLKGALIGRFIGCMLGCPVENWSIEAMEEFAKNTNTSFPPLTYWNDVKDKENLHYKKDKNRRI